MFTKFSQFDEMPSPTWEKGQISLVLTPLQSTGELACNFRTISQTQPAMNMEFSTTCPFTAEGVDALIGTIENKLSPYTLNTCFDGFYLRTNITTPLFREINRFNMTQDWWDNMLIIIKAALMSEVSRQKVPVDEPAVTCSIL